MQTKARKELYSRNEELSCFPTWFLTMTDSPPLLIVFVITVLLCAPFLMVFGALYPLFKH